ncbi:hypothetical protein ACFQBS_02640 [Planomonospora parontospora]|uniref:hypothetical protein n=1 Tax=Planomonospora parontospora TaxID=58119 RepID=UPI00360FA8CB
MLENASTTWAAPYCMALPYDTNSETRVVANARPSSAGSSLPSEGRSPTSGARQAERSGVVMISDIVAISPRWEGLNRMSMSVSMPRNVCHIMSAKPKAANAGTATRPARYPIGTAASPCRPVLVPRSTCQMIQPETAANPE